MEYFPRKIEEKLEKWISREEVILIKGPRQSGKTTLLKHLQKKYGGEYLTLEREEYAEAIKREPLFLAKTFLNKKILYLDEAQYVKDIGRYLKLIYDEFKGRLKLIVTGSGSFEVKENLGKYLVGRCVYFELLPLSFEEFVLWKDLFNRTNLYSFYQEVQVNFWEFLKNKGKVLKQTPFMEKFEKLWEEFVIFGGFPAVVKEKDHQIKVEILKNLVQTYLEKDIFFFLNVRHIEKFRNFLKALALSIGNIFETSSFARELKMDFRTVEDYVSLLKHTYVLDLIFPFHKNLVTELKKSRKIYFIDTGLRNVVINNFVEFEGRTDRGALLENFVFSELKKKGIETKYWRTTGKVEVDFVGFLENEIVPFEAKITPKLERSLRSFLKTYTPKKAVILAFKISESSFQKLGTTEIAFFPCYYI